jgi:integrase
MGRRTTDSLVGITPLPEAIELRFKYQGKTLRPRLNLKPTGANLKYAGRLRQQIVEEIERGEFDIVKHFPDYKYASKFKEAPTSGKTFREWNDITWKLAERDLEHSTLTVYKKHMNYYWLPVIGEMPVSEVTHLLLLETLGNLATSESKRTEGGLSRKMQNNIMIPLRRVFKLISRQPGAGADPTAGIDNVKCQKAQPDPFTEEEVHKALDDFRQRGMHAWADYFQFSAYAGLRASEQIDLRWSDVDLEKGTVCVHHSLVMGEEKDRTKTSTERTVELNDLALESLRGQFKRSGKANNHVFLSPAKSKGRGLPFPDEKRQYRVWTACLIRCGIRHRAPKELRDSSVTFALQSGADPWYVAHNHGHSLTVMMRDYAKWIPNADRGRNRKVINERIREGAAETEQASAA